MTADYDMILTFGKHAGKSISDIPSDYLRWLFTESTTNDEVQEAAEAEYQFREQHRTHFNER